MRADLAMCRQHYACATPSRKMAVRFQRLGVRLGCTRSLASAIMAPSLNTASSTTSSVGKYLRDDVAPGCHKPAGDTDSSSWELHAPARACPSGSPPSSKPKMSVLEGLWTWKLAGEEDEGSVLKGCILHSLASVCAMDSVFTR